MHMSPGPALDALITEQIMLWILKRDGKGDPHDKRSIQALNWCPSTNIFSSWEIVQLLEQIYDSEYESFLDPDGVRMYRFQFIERGMHRVVGMAFAHTLPHAICLAALKSIGYAVVGA